MGSCGVSTCWSVPRPALTELEELISLFFGMTSMMLEVNKIYGYYWGFSKVAYNGQQNHTSEVKDRSNMRDSKKKSYNNIKPHNSRKGTP